MFSFRKKQCAEHGVSLQQFCSGAVNIGSPAGCERHLQAEDLRGIQVDLTGDPVCRTAVSHLVKVEVGKSCLPESPRLCRKVLHRLADHFHRVERESAFRRESELDPVHSLLVIAHIDQEVCLSCCPGIKWRSKTKLLVGNHLFAGKAPHRQQEFRGTLLSFRRLVLHSLQVQTGLTCRETIKFHTDYCAGFMDLKRDPLTFSGCRHSRLRDIAGCLCSLRLFRLPGVSRSRFSLLVPCRSPGICCCILCRRSSGVGISRCILCRRSRGLYCRILCRSCFRAWLYSGRPCIRGRCQP